MKLSKIRAINSRIRRGDTSASTKKMIARAEQLGLTTKSGYISKSKKSQEDKNLQKAFEEYEQEYYEEKTDKFYQEKQDFESLLKERITPSDWWQSMRKAKNPQTFADDISRKVSDFSTFDDEYKQEFLDYVANSWYTEYNKSNSEQPFE